MVTTAPAPALPATAAAVYDAQLAAVPAIGVAPIVVLALAPLTTRLRRPPT